MNLQAVAKSPIVLFMKGTPTVPQCGFSRAVVQILDVQGVPSEKLKSYNVLEDAELREAIKEYSSWPTIPQVYVKGEFIGGCDIVLGMHQSGELEKVIAFLLSRSSRSYLVTDTCREWNHRAQVRSVRSENEEFACTL